MMRAVFAWVILKATSIPLATVSTFTEQPHPTGLAQWMDLTFFANADVARWLMTGVWICLPFYIAGIGLPLVTGWLLFVNVGACTLGASQGDTGHTFQVVGLLLLAQWISSVWRVLVKPTRVREWALAGTDALRHSFDWTGQMLAAAYVVSAVSKLVASGGLWIWKTPYFAVQIQKANDMEFHNTLVHEPRQMQWLADLLLAHPGWARVFIGIALPLELLAFLACFNRRLALVVGLALIAFHSTVSEVMELGFALNKWALLVFWVNVPFWLALAWKTLNKGNSAPSPSTPS